MALEITRPASDISGGSSANKRVAARCEFLGMKLQVSYLASVSASRIGLEDFQLLVRLTECKERRRLLSRATHAERPERKRLKLYYYYLEAIWEFPKNVSSTYLRTVPTIARYDATARFVSSFKLSTLAR